MSGNVRLYMHPGTMRWIEDMHCREMLYCTPERDRDIARLYGTDVRFDYNLKPWDLCHTWIFPAERFVRYEPSDESWCRYFGIGRSELTITRGEIVIRRDEPYYATDGRSQTLYRMEYAPNGITRDHYRVVSDQEYFYACKSKELVEKRLESFFVNELKRRRGF